MAHLVVKVIERCESAQENQQLGKFNKFSSNNEGILILSSLYTINIINYQSNY